MIMGSCIANDALSTGIILQGTEFDLVNIDLSNKPGWFTKMNGLVPVLQHDGQLHTESADICR